MCVRELLTSLGFILELREHLTGLAFILLSFLTFHLSFSSSPSLGRQYNFVFSLQWFRLLTVRIDPCRRAGLFSKTVEMR